jgi:hypothetical protein
MYLNISSEEKGIFKEKECKIENTILADTFGHEELRKSELEHDIQTVSAHFKDLLQAKDRWIRKLEQENLSMLD